MNRLSIIKLLNDNASAWMMTGSRFICTPPQTDTDEDYIALMDEGAEMCLSTHGFAMNTDLERYQEMPDFLAFRLGEYNVIVTHDDAFYKLFCIATLDAKKKNLLDKQDRIDLFQKVLYGNDKTQIQF